MTFFPVTNSNLSAAHLAAFIKEKYNLAEETTCKLIRAGINDTYLVQHDTKKYVFRVYSLNWRTKVEITEEIKLLTLLAQHSIPVSHAIADTDNEYIQELHAPEGDRFGVLFSYAAGEKIHILSKEIHFRIGVLMAQMHQLTNNLQLNRVQYTPQLILVNSLEQVSKFLSEDTEEMAFMLSTQKLILEQLSKVKTDELRQGTIHLDIWFDNLNITKEEKITIFDFDFCGNGWLVYDIAYYILQLHNIEKYEEKDYQPKVAGFLNGYQSVTKISDEETRLIPMLGVSMYFFYLGVQCQRYDNWSNSFLSENYLKRFINGLVKRYFELKKIGE